MATCALLEQRSTPVVLRVKRKRNEDPVDALVVTKRKKLLDSVDTSVFQFVGTLANGTHDQETSTTTVLDHIRKHDSERALDVKPNPLSRLSLSDRQEAARERKKATSARQRFKVISQLRSCVETEDASLPNDDSSGEVLKAGQHSVLFCDFEQAQASSANDRCSQGPNSMEVDVEKEGVISCNGVEMVREKVAPTANGFVYDLYYTRTCSAMDFTAFDWDSIMVYESELVHDVIPDPQDLQAWEEEDDSNDEDNWRNDYPDEDEYRSDHSAAEDKEGHSNAEYRHRNAYTGDYEEQCADGNYWSPRHNTDPSTDFYGGCYDSD